MVLINDQKFACQSCIKGHRSSACSHSDRPLFEIRKKGRPATQCDNCRNLRRLRRLHVKCACEGRRDPESEIGPVQIQPPTSGNRFGRKIPLVPKLPNGVRDIDTMGSNSPQASSVTSSHSRELSASDERSTDRVRPVRSCCGRKADISTQSKKSADEMHVESEVSHSSATKSTLPPLGLEFLLPQTPTQSRITPIPSKPISYSNSHQAHGMDCLCGPGCLCLGCTKHQQNGDTDTIMKTGDCPPDCPSCVDDRCGAAWPTSLSSRATTSGTSAPSSGRRMAILPPDWFAPSSSTRDFELDLDAEGEYDDDMDAEGSPDPEFCSLPEVCTHTPHIPLVTKAAKSATKSRCAGKRQPSKSNNGIAEGSLVGRGMRL